MIDAFETSVRINPNRVFFTFVDSSGQELSFTYKHARVISAALARRLKNQGVMPGDVVIAEVSNSPEYVFLILASAYAGFTIAAINTNLSESDRVAQALALERCGHRVAMHIDDLRLHNMLRRCRDIVNRLVDESTVIESISGTPRWERSIMGQKQDIIDDTVHFAEREAHLFDASCTALILFSGPGSSKSKAMPLSWNNLMQASAAANYALNEKGRQLWQERLPLGNRNSVNFLPSDPTNAATSAGSECSWQCAYPLSNIRGYQTLVRSVVGRSSLRLYETFDAELILNDRERSRVTHISVSNKMLQDLLTVEEWRLDIQPNARVRLAEYQCILIDGRRFEPRTIERATDLGVRIFAGYGIPETSGVMAGSLITPDFRGGMRLLEGYDVHIVDADDGGFGRLAVKGPGVFDGYMNSSAAFTVDHYFITGSIAALYDDCIYIKDRSTATIVVDGEHVYPAEIAEALRHIPGVSDVHVFGIADAAHGRMPVAVVERKDASVTSDTIIQMSRQWLTDANMPRRIYVSDSLPRLENGKLDRPTIEEIFRSSMKIARMTLHHVRIPFNGARASNQTGLSYRDSIIVELEDSLGRIGLGECPALANAKDPQGAISDSIQDELLFLRNVVAPSVVGHTFFHPRYTEEILSSLADIEEHPTAASAVECAIWDLYGHISEKTLWSLINEEYARIVESNMPEGMPEPDMPRVAKIEGVAAEVNADAIIDLDTPPVTMANAHNAVAAGYNRLKLRVTPERGFASVRSLRRAYPDLLVTLDANRTFGTADLEQLLAYDSMSIGWIEEPFAPEVAKRLAAEIARGEHDDLLSERTTETGGRNNSLRFADRGQDAENATDMFKALSCIQNVMGTPICVDESYRNARDAEEFLYSDNLHCISLKIAKFGGIEPALRFMAHAKLLGKVVVMGGLEETGIGRRVSASFETLPGVLFPGDIGSISRYFEVDVTYPRYEAFDGEVVLNAGGFEYGIGCILDEDQLSRVELERINIY